MGKSKKMAVLMLVLTEVICLVFAVWKIFAGNGYMETFGAGKREIPTWENPISLPAGSYQMDVVYKTASEEAWLRPMTDSSAGTVYGGKALLFPYHTEASFEVRVGIDDGWFYLDGSTEDDLTISELTVQRTNRAETARCITLLVVFAILDVLLVLWYRGTFAGMDTAQRNVLFALVMLWLLSSLPLFVNYMVTGHDFAFHMMRIEGLAKGLKSGQFPVRVQPGWLNGYGYPVSVMYGDLLLYIPALLRLGGFTLQTAYKLYVLLINAVTVAASYACAKKIGRGWKAGLLGSLVYTLSVYRLVNIYTRCALGEYTAMAFLPLVFLGLYLMLHTQEVRRGCLYMIAGYTLILQSHLLSFEMTVIFSALYCLLCGKKFLWRLGSIIKTAGVTILLNLNFLIPFADYMLREDLWIKGGTPENMQAHGLFLPQLFQLYGSTGLGSTDASGGIQADMLIGPGVLITLAAIVFLWQYLVYRKKLKEKADAVGWGEQCRLFLLLALALFMSVMFFPWRSIGEIPVIGKVFASYQFAWRFLAAAVLMGTLLWLYLSADMKVLFGSETAKRVAAGLCIFTVVQGLWFFNVRLTESDATIVMDTSGINTVNAVSGGEYLIQGMSKEHVTESALTCSEHVTIAEYRRNGNHFWVTCENRADTEGRVTVPLFAYKSYRAVDTAEGTEFPVVWDAYGAASVTLPAGYRGEFEIYYRERTVWRIGEFISLVTLLGLLAVCKTKAKS